MFNREKSESKRVPMMPVRDLVIFPQMMNPFIVGRESSLRALEEALATDKKIFLATQHDASVDDPKPDEIYSVGTLANIVQSVRLPDGNLRVLVEGVERAKAVQISTDEGFFRATLKVIPNKAEPSPQIEQAVTKVTGLRGAPEHRRGDFVPNTGQPGGQRGNPLRRREDQDRL